ncbi:MAG: hypothetical protein HDR55_00190 [Treponema sp.]|nr:hypothetical protein [Treponema sp.]
MKQANGIFRTFYFVAVKKREAKTERGVFPLAVKRKPNKVPNERAEIASPPPIQPLQKVAEALDRRSPPALDCSLITGAFPR